MHLTRLGLAFTTLLLAVAPLAAQFEPTGGVLTPSWTEQGINPGDTFGTRLALLDDHDGDGLRDLAVAIPYDDSTGVNNLGSVDIRSGADGSLIRNIPGFVADGAFGLWLTTCPDADGDGLQDLLVGALNSTVAGMFFAGTAHVVGSVTGAEILRFENDQTSGSYGGPSRAIGDLNADGFGDYLIGDYSYNFLTLYTGKVEVRSGFDGSILRTHSGVSPGDQLGNGLIALDDLDNDGVDDYAFGVTGISTQGYTANGQVQVISGATGTLLRLHEGNADNQAYGEGLCAVGDLNLDGTGDYLVSGENLLHLYSGADGSLLRETLVPTSVGWEYLSLAACGDLNLDGYPEYAVGFPAGQLVNTVFVYSGLDGTIMQVYEDPPGSTTSFSANSLAFDPGPYFEPSRVYIGYAAFAQTGSLNLGRVEAFDFLPGLYPIYNEMSAAQGAFLPYLVDFPDSHAGNTALLMVSVQGSGTVVIGNQGFPIGDTPLLHFTVTYPPPGAVAAIGPGGDTVVSLTLPPGLMNLFLGWELELCVASLDALSGQPVGSTVQAALKILP